MKRFWLIAGLLLCSSAVMAEDRGTTGNDWYQLCKGNAASRPESCAIYAMGIVSGANAQAAITNSKPLFCAPPTVNFSQFADIFYKYLEDNPDKRHNPSVVLALLSWKNAFPCDAK